MSRCACAARRHPLGPSRFLTPLARQQELPKYEHMDMIWAADAPRVVFADVLALLQKYNAPAAP